MAEEKKPGRVKSALLNWLGVPVGLTASGFWQEMHGTSSSGKAVTVDGALQLSTVWACVRLLSETVSTLPLKLYRRLPDGSREPASSHPLYRVLCVKPNAEMTPGRFMLTVVAALVMRGNAFIEKKYIGNRIVALIPIPPQLVTFERLANGRLEYTITENGAKRKLGESHLMHIRGFGMDGVTGMMPVHAGRDVLGAAMSADEAAAKFFENGMQASGFLSQEAGTLTKDQREELRKNLMSFVGSKNAAKLMVLEGGLKYQGVTMNPEAAQMLQTRAFQIEEICRWFRVPPMMVGHMEKASSWASSVEGMNLQFLTNTLRPLLDNIEQEIIRCLIGEAEADTYYAEFAVEGLLRADLAARREWYASALQNGWMSRNRVAALENMPPIPGGDIFTVQSNLIPLEQLGKSPTDSEQMRSALQAWLQPTESGRNPGSSGD